ncbi:MAG: ATP-binding protein, partial [Bacteroidota bacterium]
EEQNLLDSALEHFDSALVSLDMIGNRKELSMTHIRVGNVYKNSGERQEARKAYMRALEVARKAGVRPETALAHQHLGYLYLNLQKYASAKANMMDALKLFTEVGDATEKARTRYGLALLNDKTEQFDTAIDHAKQGLETSKRIGSRELTMDFYQILGDLYGKKGDFEKAFDFHSLKKVIADSLRGDNTDARALIELVAQFKEDKLALENEKKAQEIALQQATIKLRDQEIVNQNARFFVILGGLILVALFGAVLVYFFIQKNRANRRLQEALSDLQPAQDQLIRTEKLASLGKVTAGIAHEIRNPLNFVNSLSKLSVGMVDELAEELTEMRGNAFEGDGAEMVFEYFSDIRSNASKVLQHGERASRIVRDMLQHAASGSKEKKPAAVNALVEEYTQVAFHSVRSQNDQFDCTLDMQLAPGAGNVKVIRSDIGRALLNVIGNAFEAMVTRAQSTDGEKAENWAPLLTVKTFRRGNKVHIHVLDNGTGVPPENQNRIFEPFFTTKPPNKGTGLGLSLAYETIVQGHGGQIELLQSSTEGTEFRIILPA